MISKKAPRSRPLLFAIVAFAVVFAAGAIGSAATIPNIPVWYASLHKPAFTPPNWLFGPAWTGLYLLIAISFWRILTSPFRKTGKGLGKTGKDLAISIFLVQMTLNALWSVVFFGLHSPLYGLVVIGLLIAAIIATIASFVRIDRLSALLLLPYLIWVCFATALNAGIFLMNR